MRHLNQSGLLSQEKMDAWAICIIGMGAIGSFVAMALTKMGFKHIVAYDPDTIEEHNIANQMFPVSSVGTKKAIATRKLVKDFSGEDIVTLSVPATGAKANKFLWDNYSGKKFVYILCVDSLDARKKLVQEIADKSSALIIDARMGAKTYRVIGLDTTSVDAMKLYMDGLVPDAQAVQERCGQKSIIYTVLGVAAEVCSFLHQMITNDERGRSRIPEPVVFDYGTGLRLQKQVRGTIEQLDEMPLTPEPVALTADSVVIGALVPDTGV